MTADPAAWLEDRPLVDPDRTAAATWADDCTDSACRTGYGCCHPESCSVRKFLRAEEEAP